MDIFASVMIHLCMVVVCGALIAAACVLIGMLIKEWLKGRKPNGTKRSN